MNKLCISFLLSLLVPTAASAALPTNFFAKRSVLADGKWVKVGVDQTGVYEISYETLRQMGFQNPSSVSVFGRGGELMDPSFVKASGPASLIDDLPSVKVLHKGDKLYFFAEGVDKLAFKNLPSLSTGGYYERKSKNIYSDYGYYFLTDSQPVDYIYTQKSENLNSLKEIAEVVKFVHNEKDLQQNTTSSGQLFWGERLSANPGNRQSWDVDLSDAIVNYPGYIRYDLYLPNRAASNLNIGIEGAEKNISISLTDNPTSYFTTAQPNAGELSIFNSKTKLFFEHNANSPDFDNIDFWTLSYKANTPDLSKISNEEAAQCRFAVSGMSRGTNVKMSFANAASSMLWDITDPASPSLLDMKVSAGVGTAKIWGAGTFNDLILVDTSRPQLQICGYSNASKDVTNQNLHAYSEEGADLLIICTPMFKEASERLADIHRNDEGLKVVVATNEECYNEFSQGVPDITAYRALAYMLYNGKTKLKNVLLVGPLTNNIRGIEFGKDPLDYLIAYQNSTTSISAGAYNANDFIGIMKEYITETSIEKTDINLGVGILPFRYNSEMDNFIKKLKGYVERDDFAYYLNKNIGIGGDGDNHTHDNQMIAVTNWFNNSDKGASITTPIALESYGYNNARQKLLSSLDNGANFMIYFGHGAETMLTQKPYFFNTAHSNQLTNDFLPLICFAGCSLSSPDMDRNGLGETIVTRSPHGAIASIMASRETWAAQNLEFYKSFINSLFREYDSTSAPYRSVSPTLGEVFATTKTGSRIQNELAYQLVGDPAIRIPMALGGIRLEMEDNINVATGEKLSLSGYITNADNSVNDTFNGQIVIRIMEPPVSLLCKNLITNQTKDSPTITYEDNQVTMGVAEVKDGRFSTEIHIPSSASQFNGAQANIKMAAYDPSTHLGAGGKNLFKFVTDNSVSTSESDDNLPPVVENFYFDSDDCSISVSFSDNLALNLSDSPLSRGFFFYLDGKEFNQANNSQPILNSNNLSCSRIVRLNGLTYGNHIARVKVKDAAGNETDKEISFTYEPSRAKFAISVKEITEDNVELVFEEDAPQQCAVYIMDANGNTVYSKEFSGNRFSWNRVSLNGRPVAPGHYKAYIIETGNVDKKGHSQTVDLPLI